MKPTFLTPLRRLPKTLALALRGQGRSLGRWLQLVVLSLALSNALVGVAASAVAQEVPEYRLKAAFIYNFILFTEWPNPTGETFNLCIYGEDPFGREIDTLQGKNVSGRSIAIQRKGGGESLDGCQGVFISASEAGRVAEVVKVLKDKGVLTVADSPGATQLGVALNMATRGGRVSFQANLVAARESGIQLSSKLLRLATEVVQ